MTDTQATSPGSKVETGRSHQYSARAWKPLFAFALFASIITAAGNTAFQNYKSDIKREKQAELGEIAELKSRQITNWMNGRIGDAESLKRDPFFLAEAERWLRQGGPSDETKKKLTERLASLQLAYVNKGYTSISLFDEHARLRLSSSEGHARSKEDIEHVLASMRSWQVSFSEIHNDGRGATGTFMISLAAPLLVGKGTQAHAIGAVVFRIDPSHFLFPVIQRWPTPSASAESLLLRRDGDEVVFLNELRHTKNTPLAMRLPLGQQQFLAAQAAMGKEGLLEGMDYRGVPVFGVASKVAGTSWLVLSKIDQAEIYAPINRLAEWMTLLMLTLVGASGVVTALVRNREKRHYERELEHQAHSKHLDYLAKYANDIILLLDGAGRIVEFNDRALDAYGYSAAELSGMDFSLLRAMDFTPPLPAKLKEIDLAGALRFESTHVRRNGAAFPVEASVRRIDMGEGKLYQFIIRDITERKAANDILLFHSNILQSLEEGIFLIRTSDGVIVFTNPQFERIFGYGRGELLGKHVSTVNAPGDPAPEEVAGMINSALAQKGAWSGEVRNRKKDGTAFWCHVNVSTFEHPQFGKVWVAVHEDINERKQAIEKLRQSEEHFRFLTENASDMTYLVSLPDRYYNYVSPSAKQLTGYTPEEFYNSPQLMQRILHPDWHGYCEAQWEKILGGEVPAQLEFQITHKSGEARWMQQRNSPIWKGDGSGTPIAIQCVITDITAQKQAAEQLQFSNALLTTAQETSIDGILVVDTNGRIISFNRPFVKMWQVAGKILEASSDEQFLQSILDKLNAPVIFMEKVRHLYAHPKQTSRDELSLRDGRTIERYTAPMTGAQGKYYGRIWYFRDISERKQAEEKLHQQKNFLHQIIDTDPNLIYVKDADGRFLMANQALANFYRVAVQKMIGKSNAELDSGQRGLSAYLAADIETLKNGKELILTDSSLTPDGGRHWYLTIKKPLAQADGSTHILGIAVDITGQKLSEIQLAESYRELQQLTSHLDNIREDERARIARELHDEMGATLAALKMRAAWLASKLPPELALLAEEAGLISGLVSDGIRTLRQVVSQLRPSLLEDVGLEAAIESYVRQFRQSANIECTLGLPEEGLGLDPDRAAAIFRILQESLNNIAKHAQASKVDILFSRRSNSLSMVVEDNGIGFTQNSGEKSFGLLGIRERALIAGGKAKISSMQGKGTRVAVTVPTSRVLAKQQKLLGEEA